MAKKEKQTAEENKQETSAANADAVSEKDSGKKDSCEKEISELQAVIEKKNQELADADDRVKRLAAEFDNFKKRTAKEKEGIYSDSVCDVIGQILPIIDNLDRALDSFEDKENDHYKGVEMVLKQTLDIFNKIGVEEISAVGQKFDPSLHNAVMHVEDDNFEENIIAEQFQRGYKYKDKVIRYSMVKVAN